MSYLVEALKKAERERHAQRAADIGCVAASEQPAPRRARPQALRVVVAALLVCNVGLFAYMVLAGASGGAQRASSPAGGGAPAQTAVTKTSSVAAKAPDPRTAKVALTSGEAAASAPDGRSASPLKGLRLSDAPARSTPAGRSAPAASAPGVRYARAPLAPGRTGDRSAPARTTPQARGGGHSAPAAGDGQPDSAPRVRINGHLYSSVPGRSFILVGGQRYHEGQRLASGPAVVSIDITGATLNYRGHRYHVNGPG